MAAFRIAHLSDLHILRDYRGSMLDQEPLCQPVFPVEYFRTGLREAAAEHPDLIVLTGDLVHEGTAEDYQYLRRIIEQESRGIPVLPVLGNHDLKACFYQGYLGERRDGRYYYKYESGGYRFLVLDTAEERNCHGSITAEQAAWLKEELKTPAPRGTVLLGHHPLESGSAWFHTDCPAGFAEILEKSDVFAYLCGHAHYAEIRTVQGIQQITAESFAFGVEPASPTEVFYTETRGYNTCWLEGPQVIVHPQQVFPFHSRICRIPF